jgi:cytidylate kinase
MIIAIDGPAASGKGTLAKRLAQHYGLPHLDTGLLYRAIARSMLDCGARLDDVEAAVRAARAINPASFDEKELKGASRFRARRRGARWTRHRYGGLPGRRREDLRNREP